MELEELLKNGFEELGLDYDAEAERRFRIYYGYLTEINQVMNLTAISGERDVAQRHFLDCAELLRTHDFRGKKVIDIGTGAGFPGLVLKIAQPDIRLTLLDSLDKRIGFLRDSCRRLGFEDVSCIHARAEEIPEEMRGSFDIAVSRAVARLNLLSELCLPYVKKGGVFIVMKGAELAEELSEAERAIRTLGAEVERHILYTIPGTELTHSAVILRKTADTPKKYPRRWAQIKKTPL